MRELDECKAEVFRRSEKRIEERKRNRNRTLALCIPLCLIATAWSVTILPTMRTVNDKNMSVGESMDIAGGVDGSNAAFAQLEVECIGNATQSTILKDDANEVAQFYYTVQSAFVDAGEGNKESENNGSSDDAEVEEYKDKDCLQSETTTMSSGYRIIFTMESGTKVVYSLSGNKLINESTKQEATLSTEQRSEILTALDITITWEEESE